MAWGFINLVQMFVNVCKLNNIKYYTGNNIWYLLLVLDDEIAAKNEIINRSETEIVKRNAIIERKQGIIDQYNKRLELMITSAGVRKANNINYYIPAI